MGMVCVRQGVVCATKIRNDAKGIGKFAPHSALLPGYELHFVLMAHWAAKEARLIAEGATPAPRP